MKLKGEVRLAKVTANPFNDEGDMKLYHHPACMFQTFQKVRATTKVIEVNFLVSFKQLKEFRFHNCEQIAPDSRPDILAGWIQSSWISERPYNRQNQ